MTSLKCLIILVSPLLFTQATKGTSVHVPAHQSKNRMILDQAMKHDEMEEEKPLQFMHTLENRMYISSGSSLQLDCQPNNNEEPATDMLWSRNDIDIKRVMGEVIYKKWSIQLDDVIPDDSGWYRCFACYRTLCLQHSTNVIVYYNHPARPMIITKLIHNQTILRNSDTSLECRVISELVPLITWVKTSEKNEPIRESLHRIYDPKFYLQRIERTLENILKIHNVSHDDEGWYTCSVISSAGQAQASAYIRVIDDDKVPKENYDKVPKETDDKVHKENDYKVSKENNDKVPKENDEKVPKENREVQIGQTGWITIAAIVVVVTMFVGTIYIVYILRNLKYSKQELRSDTFYQWTKTVIITNPSSDDSFGDLQIPDVKIVKQRIAFKANLYKDPAIEFSEYDFPMDCSWEIPRSQISLGLTLGEGAFGRVVMAQVSLSTTVVVAVKMIKDDYTDADVISLVREMELMKIIGSHKNIINLLGCCSQNGPLWVIVEFARHGNLKDFLKNNRSSCLAKEIHLTEKHLTKFARQIAQGMEYLASKRCIHRDLAARNVLVSDDYIMKIADFGLARDIHESDYYRKCTNGRLPIKWMAPESLQKQFYNSQTDIWSYGVLLWEIMSYGDQPYPYIMSSAELYSYLISGNRMEIPKDCSHKIYELMIQCWHLDSNARPMFTEIVKILDEIIQLSSIKFNTRYVNLPELVLNNEEEDDQRTQESVSVSYTPMFRISQ